MSAYIDSIRRAPKTLTETEQRSLLKATGQHRAGFRDHVIFSLALGTALREHEILALDVGDVFDDAGKARRRVNVRVFKGCNEDSDPQEVILPDALRAKLDKFHGWKRRAKPERRPGCAPLHESSQKETVQAPGSARLPCVARTRRV